MLKQFKYSADYETSTARCPCGSSVTWSGLDVNGLNAWQQQHRAHVETDEIERVITADGERAYS